MLDETLDTIRRLILAALLILLVGAGIGAAASYAVWALPARRDAETLQIEVAALEAMAGRLRTELEECLNRPGAMEESGW